MGGGVRHNAAAPKHRTEVGDRGEWLVEQLHTNTCGPGLLYWRRAKVGVVPVPVDEVSIQARADAGADRGEMVLRIELHVPGQRVSESRPEKRDAPTKRARTTRRGRRKAESGGLTTLAQVAFQLYDSKHDETTRRLNVVSLRRAKMNQSSHTGLILEIMVLDTGSGMRTKAAKSEVPLRDMRDVSSRARASTR